MAILAEEILFYLEMDQHTTLIDKKALARALGISIRTLSTLVAVKRIPVIRITRKLVRFDIMAVMAALGPSENVVAGGPNDPNRPVLGMPPSL
jgi:hypothetical protein